MKTLRSVIILAILATLSLVVLSFHANRYRSKISGDGHIAQKVYKLSDFRQVVVRGGIDLYLQPSDKNEAVIVSDKNIIDALSIMQKNGELLLGFNKHIQKATKGTKVYLSYKYIDGVKAISNCSVNMKNGATLKAQSLSIITKYNSDIDMNIDVEKLTVQSSSNTSSILTGKANTASIKISTNSDLDAKRLTSSEMEIKASLNSNAYVKALKTAKASAKINSDITIIGKPKNLYTSIAMNSGIVQE